MVYYLKTTLPSIKNVIYFIGGALINTKTSRTLLIYATKKITRDLKQDDIYLQQAMTRAPVMALGGTVKHLDAQASLQKIMEDHILTNLNV